MNQQLFPIRFFLENEMPYISVDDVSRFLADKGIHNFDINMRKHFNKPDLQFANWADFKSAYYFHQQDFSKITQSNILHIMDSSHSILSEYGKLWAAQHGIGFLQISPNEIYLS